MSLVWCGAEIQRLPRGGDRTGLLGVVAVRRERTAAERIAVVVTQLLAQHVDVGDLLLAARRRRLDRRLRRRGPGRVRDSADDGRHRDGRNAGQDNSTGRPARKNHERMTMVTSQERADACQGKLTPFSTNAPATQPQLQGNPAFRPASRSDGTAPASSPSRCWPGSRRRRRRSSHCARRTAGPGRFRWPRRATLPCVRWLSPAAPLR